MLVSRVIAIRQFPVFGSRPIDGKCVEMRIASDPTERVSFKVDTYDFQCDVLIQR